MDIYWSKRKRGIALCGRPNRTTMSNCCNYEQLTSAMSVRGVGAIVGAVALGLINEIYKDRTDLFIAGELLLSAACLSAVPWTPTLPLMGITFFMIEVAGGGLSASGNAHVIYLWGEKVLAPVHYVHFGFGNGTVFGPFFAGPFIAQG